MAIVQISRITQRKGLSENLPQLAGAEFGWVIDERRLFIGNGTLEEGAPAIGNTEILTQYSDIFAIIGTYTYKGEAGGYTVQTGPTSGDPVKRTLQAKLDDMASIKDFGAVGDGVADDTDAINRALYQMFCREANPEVRRSIFFPAGIYRVTDSIKIPPYCKLYGEGSESSIIQLDVAGDSTYGSYVAQTADSFQQTGVNIGENGAITPRNIEIADLGFETTVPVDCFLIEKAFEVYFTNVNFIGPYTTNYIQDNVATVVTDDISAIRFVGSSSYPVEQIVFDRGRMSGFTYACYTDQGVSGVTVSNIKVDTHYKGFELGTGTLVNGGPTAIRLVHNLFDSIYEEGVLIGNVENNMLGYNIFLDVGNHIQGAGNPETPVVKFNADNNVSVGDMFERDEADNNIEPRLDVGAYKVFALDKGERYKFGTYRREAGGAVALDLTGSPTTIITVSTDVAQGFTMMYRFKDDLTLASRFGQLNVVAADGDDSAGTLSYTDDYSESNPTDLTLSVVQVGSNIQIKYTLDGVASGGTFNYSISHLG